uniref:FAR1 domain-containing protein n=1 Tax=Peronospora matthiolae TaxID=2874970 RepID=A0AAV1U7M5_9STRA
MSLEPPVHLVGVLYASKHHMQKAFNAFAAEQGYAIVTKHSYKHRKGRQKVHYKCDRGGTYRSTRRLEAGSRQRKSKSACTGCGFKLLGTEHPGKTEHGRWSFTIEQGGHNHAPSAHPTDHAIHMRLSEKQMTTVKNLIESGVRVRDIQTYLKSMDDGIEVTKRKIYNILRQSKCEQLDRLTLPDVPVSQQQRNGEEENDRETITRQTLEVMPEPEPARRRSLTSMSETISSRRDPMTLEYVEAPLMGHRPSICHACGQLVPRRDSSLRTLARQPANKDVMQQYQRFQHQ